MINKILITGAAGFIGRGVSRYFSRRGYSTYGIDILAPENAPIADLARYFQIKLPSNEFGNILKLVCPDVILHCAGRSSVTAAMSNPGEDYADGPILTFYLLDTIRQIYPSCAFVHLSSAAVYGNPHILPIKEEHIIQPISAYGFHKWQSEVVCREFAFLWGLKTVNVRIFSAYGPGLRRQVLWDITNKILNQPVVNLQGTGQESRDFIHIQDIVRGLEFIINHSEMNGQAYNLASGAETRIIQLANLILELIGLKKEIVFSGILPAGTPQNWQADINMLKQLGFIPQIALQEGVRNYVLWARSELQG